MSSRFQSHLPTPQQPPAPRSPVPSSPRAAQHRVSNQAPQPTNPPGHCGRRLFCRGLPGRDRLSRITGVGQGSGFSCSKVARGAADAANEFQAWLSTFWPPSTSESFLFPGLGKAVPRYTESGGETVGYAVNGTTQHSPCTAQQLAAQVKRFVAKRIADTGTRLTHGRTRALTTPAIPPMAAAVAPMASVFRLLMMGWSRGFSPSDSFSVPHLFKGFHGALGNALPAGLGLAITFLGGLGDGELARFVAPLRLRPDTFRRSARRAVPTHLRPALRGRPPGCPKF